MSAAFPGDRTAIVTGAASARGIGRATAHRLAAGGWHIGVVDRDEPATLELARELAGKYGISAVGIGADLAQESEAHEAVRAIEAALPQIVGLANIAGVSSPLPYLGLETAEWHRVLEVNLHAVHYLTQPVAAIMARQRVGRIVTVSSVSAQRGGGTFGRTPYSVSKAAVLGFTRALARELGPFDVTVNAVAPGPIDTDIMGGTLDDARKAELAREQLIGRIGTVRDVAAAIDFLLSEDAGFVTGHTLNVNGGLYLG